MNRFLKILFYAVAAIYPILVFVFLVVLRLPLRILSLCMILAGASFFIGATGTKKSGKKNALGWKPLLTSMLLSVAGIFCFVTQKSVFLKIYPVAVSAVFLFVFAGTLFFPPTIVFRLATFADKTISGSAFEEKVESYCKKVTLVWCGFFLTNGTIAFCTVFFADDKIWSLYNGGISYVVMGLIFAIEFFIRKRVDKKMIKPFTITKFKNDSRADDFPVCFDDVYSKKIFKTWKDFLRGTASVRKFVNEKNSDRWILHCEDYFYFLVTFVALLQCKKKILLTQNITEKFIAEIKTDGVEFLTDQNFPGADFIPSIVENSNPDENEIRLSPQIDSEKTEIFMYTSGSTGKPKAVLQRMKEFEEDNAFIIKKWGAEFLNRASVTTVSQHHIYGFLFGVSLPFALGVPFRRKRIEFPEEFEKLSDRSYMIIATPAFLKRTVDARGEEKLDLKNPWIFTSGGAVSPELAVSTEKIFGFCPLEVYGSTETSGIAYRTQKTDGLVWTPFDNAKVWKGDDGCLRIISPYIKNPEGFATADLVDFQADGKKFLLKGRSDSIVKIEEKRISMTEVENRILETKLVSDVKVIALSNEVRQYLAAAIVLNQDGKEKFRGKEKFDINKFFREFLMKYFENVVLPKKFRYPDSLPVDVQGKKHKEEIAALFETEDEK